MLNVAIKVSHPRKKSLPYSGTQLLKIFKVGDFQMTIVVKSFAGANCTDMEDFLKPVVRKEPENIILHVGTNDLNKSARSNSTGNYQLGNPDKSGLPQTSITISEILPRTDKSNLLIKAS